FDERGPVAERAMHDVTITAFGDAKETAPMQSAAARLGLVALEESAGDVLDGRGGRLLHAQIDPLTLSSVIAGEQREHHRDRAEVRRRVIRLESQRTNGSVTRKTIDVEHPAERGQHGVVGDVIAVRAGLAEGCNRAEHERGILAMENIPAKAELVERARRETLNDDVGAARELEKNVRAARMVEVERERALVEIVEPEEQAAVAMRQVVEERAHAARVVTGGRLDLDDVGAHVAE